ncbi:MAG: VWA domain-containing protein [Bryobacteraceae bacterium]
MMWAFAAALLLQAQDEVRVSSHAYVPQSPYTLRVDTKLVEIAAVVRDGHGKAIAGLTKDDFRILDDGKTRLIDHFVVENTLDGALNDHNFAAAPEAGPASAVRPPRFLALFIDDVNGKDGSLAAGLKQTQVAAEKFVKEALKPDIRIGIFTASGTPTLDFTSDEVKLSGAIAALKAHVKMREEGLTSCPRITPYLAYKIAYDHDRSAISAVIFESGSRSCPVTAAAVVTQAEETWRRVKEISTDTLNSIGRVVDHLGAMSGRRELLVASSGFLTVSMQDQKDKIIDQALRAGVVISALDSKGIYSEPLAGTRPQDAQGYDLSTGRAVAAFQKWMTFETVEMPLRLQTLNESLADLAEGTGGMFYHNNNDLAAGFRELGDSPQITYRISFRPDGVAPDGGYHKLKVSLVHAKYSVQARPGYFAPNEKAAAESLQSKIDREILADDTVAEFPVGIAVQREKTGLAVIVKVDISKLRFVKNGERQMQKIVFTTALIDGQGKIAAAKEGQMDLALTEATYKRLAASGVNAIVSLAVPPGTYQLRQVTEEAVDGKMACSTHPIEIK